MSQNEIGHQFVDNMIEDGYDLESIRDALEDDDYIEEEEISEIVDEAHSYVMMLLAAEQSETDCRRS